MMFFPVDSFQLALKDANRQRPELEEASSTVRRLLNYVDPVSTAVRCVDVLDHFIRNEDLPAVAVVDQYRTPVGIIDRGKISEIFLKPYSRDLLHNKKITEIMDKNPIVVDIDAGIDDVAKIIIDSGMHHMVNGFIASEDGVYAGMATGHALLEEITLRRQRDLYILAHYDQLTGLPNRLLFNDRLQQACQNALRTGSLIALIFVDLDRFKYINDSMGHSFGDRLLRGVADRLTACVRQSDTVARLGGDEFVIILQNVEKPSDVDKVLANVGEHLRSPMPIFEREIQVTASMGVAFYPLHDDSIDGLIRKADAAMYDVKESGRNAYRIYSEAMDQGNMQRMSLETQLRMALESGELSLFYQPQIHLPDHNLVGVEALLRWRHPEMGMVSPAEFIPIAEETGLIVPIGEWALREACRQHLNWTAEGMPTLRMSVNISAVQFQQAEFCSQIKRIVEESGIDPQYLELELTESVVMNHAEQAVRTLRELRQLGVKLAIDDFGTGYSSLSYLNKFPIDRIKIDQSFIRYIKETPANQAIVKAIVALGDSLGMETVAEGVESGEELACVTNHRCHEVQGYHFAKPMAGDDFAGWLVGFSMQAPFGASMFRKAEL